MHMPPDQHPTSKVIIITHEFFPKRGGISTYVQQMGRALASCGVETCVWAPRDRAIDGRQFSYPVVQMPIRSTQGLFSYLWVAVRLLRSHGELAEHILYLPEPGPIRAMMALQLLRRYAPRKFVVTLHGSEIRRLSRPFYRKALFERLLLRAERIGVVSEAARELLRERFPHRSFSTELTPGGLRNDLDPKPSVPRKNRKRLKLLTVARLHPRKGQLYLLRAVTLLSKRHRERLDLSFVGPRTDRRYARELRAYARRHLIALTMTGDVPDAKLRAYYRDSDIFAFTSVPYGSSVEGFGLSNLEASAFGLPILAFRTGGVEEAVLHDKTGLLCPPADTRNLAAQLARLIEEPDLRARLGQGGVEHSRAFSWKGNVHRLFGPLISPVSAERI